MLEVNGWIKFADEDSYENGCLDTTFTICGDDRFTAKTEDELVSKLMDFVGVSDKDCVSVNACGEAGRIDICRTENGDSGEPSERELQAFKSGDINLWYACYSFQVERVTRKTFTFSKNCGYQSN